jgi:hypothetical protein
LKPLTARHGNTPDERGRGADYPDRLSAETRAVMTKAWADSESAEQRARDAADRAHEALLKSRRSAQ